MRQILCSALAVLSCASFANDKHLSYDDLFHLESAANPVFTADGKQVIYERRSMDIMRGSLRRNLWQVSIDGQQHLPLLSDSHNHFAPVLSPDGKQLAYLSSKDGSVQVYVRDLTTERTTKVTEVEHTPNGLAFSPDSKQLAFVMFTPSKTKPLFTLPSKPKGAQWADEAIYIDQTLFQRDGRGMNKPGNTQLYVVPVIGGTPRQLTAGEFDVSNTVAWQDQSHIIFSANAHADADFDVFNSDLHRIDITSLEITTLTDMTGPEANPTLSPDGSLVAFTGFVDNGKSNQITQLYTMDLSGKNVRSLTAELDRSVADITWDASGQGVFFSYDNLGAKHIGYVTLAGEITSITNALGGQSIGRPYTSGDFAVNADGAVVFTQSVGVQPADLVFQSAQTQTVLTDLNRDVFGHKTLNAPENMVVKSSVDQRDIHAWIVTPPDFDPSKTYPLILEIHGGPHTAYGPEFSSEVQLFAAAGYVVLYGNPRGSTSQGADFANTIDKNYPSEDYNDLMDMVDGVIAKGYVDEDNLFVTGGSGGGVLTAWIIGNTDRFKAAVVAKPVINWTSMIGTSDIYTFMAKYWFTDLPWHDYEQYWSRSPLSLVGKVNTPTMVLTGELDVRTPMAESEQYYGALRLEGVESSLVRIQGAYHGIATKPSNLARKIGNILGWFDRYKTTPEPQTKP